MARAIFFIEGHIIQEKLLSEVVALVTSYGCDFRIIEFNVGKNEDSTSFLKIELYGNQTASILGATKALSLLGMSEENRTEAFFKPALADGFVSDDFYVTGSHSLDLFYEGEWISIKNSRSDTLIIQRDGQIESVYLRNVKKDDLVLCGDEAVRVNRIDFNHTTYERSSTVAAMTVASILLMNRSKKKKTVLLAGSVAIRAGGGGALEKLVKDGFISTLLTNNDLAVYDIEASLFNTILGYSTADGLKVQNGRRNTLRAINRINGYGSISLAIESGALTHGLMFQLEKKMIPYSLAGSISDIEPLLDTITDTKFAQEQYSLLLKDTETLIMFSSYQNAVTAAKLVPSWVQIFFIDINSSVVTRLIDMAAPQAVGIVSDVGLFLNDLTRILDLDNLPRSQS